MLYNIQEPMSEASSMRKICTSSSLLLKLSSVFKSRGNIFVELHCRWKMECVVMPPVLNVDFPIEATITHLGLSGSLSNFLS